MIDKYVIWKFKSLVNLIYLLYSGLLAYGDMT